ncbi:hypothetical protein H8697_00995 [[Eubacterium] tenue]|nr:hypothetical protein [[Eubacterium] tenue]MBC8630286.1 hypothetical protein [[Eubacterium] tenue]
MVNILEVNIKEDGILDVQINESLLALFESDEEMFTYIDTDILSDALTPFANVLIERAKLIKSFRK